ncbi:hypothetical protein [Microvirga puerhi]|uniref:Glycine zipper domain-containing protein n=1 Tax=Microvirga puerhi TaxID=2876078 RepID=A0ABS7VNT2_9HYPH|nr:hypothetical protein [Microvirga puerhi]MBZ6077188.1 hypothetical protein [Microvirga puerhi]
MRRLLLAFVPLTALALSPTLAMAQAATAAGAGTGALAGAVVGGPVGAAVGGVIGGVVGASAERPRYRVSHAPRRTVVRRYTVAPRNVHRTQASPMRKESRAFRPLG